MHLYDAVLGRVPPREPIVTATNWDFGKTGQPEKVAYNQLTVHGYDNGRWAGRARVYPLPEQQGIPGWQRIVWTKVFPEPDGNVWSAWLYEGCVLPGGHMMLGRWLQITPPSGESGPFLFWRVESEQQTDILGGTDSDPEPDDWNVASESD